MAGEYVRWLARDVKPVEKKELTPRQKRRNWWSYHKWHVVIAIVCLLLGADMVSDAVRNGRNAPDYTIAYVGAGVLPEELIVALEEGIAGLGEDLNGNGRVQARILQYQLSGTTEQGFSASMQLTLNIESSQSVIYLLEDPELFGSTFPILCNADGTLPGEGSEGSAYYLWKDCPVLAGLELGTVELAGTEGTVEADCQLAMSGVAVARRVLLEEDQTDQNRGAIRLFEGMIAGAAR